MVRGGDRLTFGPIGTPGAGEVTDRLLVLRVHTHHWQALGQEPFGSGVDVPELGITVVNLTAGPGLGHALQAEAHLMQ
ncbi:hypothetical protein EES42_43585 [Streptomyces sp. ADI95-17]|nr:hypothetical protein EES42_43585 [Streptomyces sp. ADI95-17]